MTTTEQEKKEERRAKTERGVTLFTAGIASVVAAQGMYVMFSESLNMPLPLTLLCFAFIELMVVASAMRARTSQLATGSAGVDGIAMWVLTILSGVLAASHATEDVGLLILRLAAPLVAAWGWERSMALERRQLTGRTERRTNWRISPQRLLVKWGFADPTDRTTAEVAVERRLADLARAADVVRLARSTGGGRRERRAMQRLHRAIDRAAEDGIVLGEESVRDRLAEHLEGRFSAYTLPNYHPRADWADHAAKSIRPTLDAIEVEQAVLDEFERELSAFETAVDRSPLAGEVRSVARGSLVSDGAVHAVTEAAPPASDVSEVPLATPEQTAHPVSDTDAPHADTSLVSDAANFAHEPKSLAASSGSPLAAHTVDEQGSDHGSLAAHRTEDLGFVAISEELPHVETEGAQAPTARATDVARERRAAVSLVSVDREDVPVAREHVAHERRAVTPVARDNATQGALARAAEPQALVRADRSQAGGHGPFDRELSHADAERFARAVIDRGLMKQPLALLTEVYVLASQGISPNAIGKAVGKGHSTVDRALERVQQVVGPRPV